MLRTTAAHTVMQTQTTQGEMGAWATPASESVTAAKKKATWATWNQTTADRTMIRDGGSAAVVAAWRDPPVPKGATDGTGAEDAH